MKTRRIFAGFVAAAVMAAVSAVSVSAEGTEPAGYVAFTAIESTLGKGFCVEPVMVPFYEGENGLDVVERAADIKVEESEYGAYITGFADNDNELAIPEQISAVIGEELSGKTVEGYLSSMDYTAESGWSYFINGEYAMVGISDYVPADGDVLEFRFTLYGYGADLGIDNSSWGGAAALVEPVDASELIKLCASADDEMKNSWNYVTGMEALAEYGVTQEEIDVAIGTMTEVSLIPISDAQSAEASSDEQGDNADVEKAPAAAVSDDKGSPDTGAEGLAVILGAAILAGGAIVISKKR